MAKTKNRYKKVVPEERDSAYFLKIILFFILGTIWIGFKQPIGIFNGLPVGLLLGLLFASHDHFAIDRKIEYAILLFAVVLSAFSYKAIIMF